MPKTYCNKHLSKYKPDFPQKLKDHMAAGFSFESFAGVIEVGVSTMWQWVKQYPEFGEAKKVGHAKSLLYHEKDAIEHMNAPNYKEKIWMFGMKNRFGWTDKLDLSQKDPTQMSKDEIEMEIERLEESLEKGEIHG